MPYEFEFRQVKMGKMSRCPSGWKKQGKDCVLYNEKRAMKTMGLHYPSEIKLFRQVTKKRIRNCLR